MYITLILLGVTPLEVYNQNTVNDNILQGVSNTSYYSIINRKSHIVDLI